MRNFVRIASGINPIGLLHELARQPELWGANNVRTFHPESAHKLIEDIVLRYNKFEPGDDFIEKVCASIDVVDYLAWHKLPAAQEIVMALAASVKCVHLGRVMITRLVPGSAIPAHSDRIEPAELEFPLAPRPAVYYERYHVPLASEPGNVFVCGEEDVYMAPGEIWWFNNQLVHEVINNSPSDRIHLIIDCRVARDEYGGGKRQVTRTLK
jgi:Aspartyl/Asparaginyl beta-hydroxylase